MQRNHRFLGIAAIALAIGLAGANDADACSCVGWTRLEETAKLADAVLVGQVVSHFVLKDPNPDEGQSVAYMHVQVLESIRGPSKGLRIRVWDRGWGSTCSASLSQFPRGAIVGLALERNKEYRKDQGPHGLTIETSDFLMGRCAEYGRVMASLEEGHKFVAQMTKGAKRGK